MRDEFYKRHQTFGRRLWDSVPGIHFVKTLWGFVWKAIALCFAVAYLTLYCMAVAQVSRVVQRVRIRHSSRSAYRREKGGEFRQAGYQQRGSLIRPGGSLNSDDLRRRLNELRSTDPGGPGRRAPNRGGQHGQ